MAFVLVSSTYREAAATLRTTNDEPKLDPKKGTACHQMLNCDHVFCLQCLQDFYNDAIKEGNLQTVRCLSPNCAKEQAAAAKAKGIKKPKSFISPSELLQIGLSEEVVKRFVALKYKTELEADKDTIYCPRQWCNGAARSKKHKKPKGLELTDVADDEEEADEQEHADGGDKTEAQDSDAAAKFDPADLLAVCEDCGLAFCSRCLQSWHGEFVRCMSKQDRERMTAEDLASLEYLKMHTSPCPTCNASAQKTHGCNHMICPRCDTHFCYLCSAWLDPGNPYRHYNQQSDGRVTSCYMRLWELEAGDGDNVGLGFVGGQPIINIGAPAPAPAPARAPAPAPAPVRRAAHAPQAPRVHPARPQQWFIEGELVDEAWGQPDEEAQIAAIILDQGQDQQGQVNDVPQAQQEQPPPPVEAVAREAPLVLRVMGNAQVPPAAAAAAAPEALGANRNHPRDGPVPPGRGGREQPGRGRGGGRDRGGGGRGGRRDHRPHGQGQAPAQGRGRGQGGGQHPRDQRNRRGGGGGGDNNNHNNYNHNRHQQQDNANGPPLQPGRVAAGGLDNGELNQDQQAWVRRFVAMAMEDVEDDLNDDSDVEQDDWFPDV